MRFANPPRRHCSVLARASVGAALFITACGGSPAGPSQSVKAATGTYTLQSVEGAPPPVFLFPQCSLGGAPPCGACRLSAASGTLILNSASTQDYSISLVTTGVCTDPSGRSPTSNSTATRSDGGRWSEEGGGTIRFTRVGSGNLNLGTGTLSGSALSLQFDWPNDDNSGFLRVTTVWVK